MNARKPVRIYVTTYCNHGHDMATGRPVDHECRIIPPAAIQAELDGDFETAVAIMDRASRHGEMRVHRGIAGSEVGK